MPIACCCTRYRVPRRCDTGEPSAYVAMKSSDAVAIPVFSASTPDDLSGPLCFYFDYSDPTYKLSEIGGIVLAPGDVTPFLTCEACGPTHYRIPRLCSTDEPSDYISMTVADSIIIGSQIFKADTPDDAVNPSCYYFNFDDPTYLLADIAGDVISAASVPKYDSCDLCNPTKYRIPRLCTTGEPSDYVSMTEVDAALVGSQGFSATTLDDLEAPACYYFDFSDPTYFLADIAGDVLPIGSVSLFDSCLLCSPRHCYDVWHYDCATDTVSWVSNSCLLTDPSNTNLWHWTGTVYEYIQRNDHCLGGDCTPSEFPPEAPSDKSSCPQYRKFKKCTDDTLVDIGIIETDVSSMGGAFNFSGDCYYLDSTPTYVPPAVIVSPSDTTPADNCGTCSPTVPCDGPDVVHALYRSDAIPRLCEVDLYRTEGCNWANSLDCSDPRGGVDFTIAQLSYDSGSGSWIVSGYDSTSSPRSWSNSGGDATHLPLGKYTDVSDGYIIISI